MSKQKCVNGDKISKYIFECLYMVIPFQILVFKTLGFGVITPSATAKR